MNILFLDQSGSLGGAELFLLDLATYFRASCAVALLSDGAFRTALEERHIPVQVLTGQALTIKKESGLLQGFSSITRLVPLIAQVAKLAQEYDLIYANTQKALVIGAIASWLAHRPLVYHLHDIVSPEHFSTINRRIIITLANRFASLVIANSQASQAAFIAAGGRKELTTVVYNGFSLDDYGMNSTERDSQRQQLGVADRFVIGHFSRLSPWKGQHILIEALTRCSDDVVALLVGDALFGEQEYVNQLHQLVKTLGLEDRVHFLGFRSNIPQLMAACDLIAHTSTAPEPFGRVIVEGMLSSRPVIAAAAGGAVELIDHGRTGWLCPPGDPSKLAEIIMTCHNDPAQAAHIAQQGQIEASQRFDVAVINQQIAQLLDRVQ